MWDHLEVGCDEEGAKFPEEATLIYFYSQIFEISNVRRQFLGIVPVD
jgi:hypothetical protein